MSISGRVVQPWAALAGAPSSFYIALQRRKDRAQSASAAWWFMKWDSVTEPIIPASLKCHPLPPAVTYINEHVLFLYIFTYFDLYPGPYTVLYLSAAADTTLQNGIWWCVCAERHSGIYHRRRCQGRSFVDFNGFPVKVAEPMSLLLLFPLLQCVFRQLTAVSATARGYRNMDLFCGVTCQEKVVTVKSDQAFCVRLVLGFWSQANADAFNL